MTLPYSKYGASRTDLNPPHPPLKKVKNPCPEAPAFSCRRGKAQGLGSTLWNPLEEVPQNGNSTGQAGHKASLVITLSAIALRCH